jgi:hypothetical protein
MQRRVRINSHLHLCGGGPLDLALVDRQIEQAGDDAQRDRQIPDKRG